MSEMNAHCVKLEVIQHLLESIQVVQLDLGRWKTVL